MKKWLLICTTVICIICNPAVAKENNILVIQSYDSDYAWSKRLNRGIESELSRYNGYNIYYEFMDANRFSDLAYTDNFYGYLKSKYENNIDINGVLLGDDPIVKVFLDNKNNFFGDIPIIYMGVDEPHPELETSNYMTGITEERGFSSILTEIKRLLRSEKLVVISDKSSTGNIYTKKVKNLISNNPQLPQDVRFIDELHEEDIESAFLDIPDNIPVLFMGNILSKSGGRLDQKSSSFALTSRISNPVIGINEVILESGALGAYDVNAESHAAIAARMLLYALNGKHLPDSELAGQKQNQWYFNWQQMNTHGIDVFVLPPGAIQLREDHSFAKLYQKTLTTAAVFALFAVSIIVLLIVIIRKTKQSKLEHQANEIRYRDLAFEGANVFFETDVEHRIQYIQGDTLSLFGLGLNLIKGHSLLELSRENPHVSIDWGTYYDAVNNQKPIRNLKIIVSNPFDENKRIIVINAKPISDKNNVHIGYRGLSKDITEEYLLSEQVNYESQYDQVIGIYNRHTLNTKLFDISRTSDAQSTYFCVIDLNRFSLINDAIGHEVGNQFLIKITELIKKCVNTNDILGRVGNCEFGLVTVCKEKEQLYELAHTIISNISEYRFYWDDEYYNVGANIGAVEVGDLSRHPILFSHANLALSKAKESGGENFYLVTEEDEDISSKQQFLGYVANIQQALEEDRFSLVKQKISPLHSDSQYEGHYEILLRYKDKSGSSIPPGVFIPLAEQHGVIKFIDEWVVSTVLMRYKEFFPEGKTKVSINLSGISLSDKEFISRIEKIAEVAQIDMSLICFEITETAVITDLAKALHFINEMKSLGCSFALDDFGSGSSSFGYLKQLPMDYLKIDGSLIKNILSEPIDQKIVESICMVAREMNMKTIAEFVESEEIISLLKRLDVDYGQGYGIHKPSPV